MALTGNCTFTTYAVNEEGQTVGTNTDYTDIYLCITQISNFNNWLGDDEGNPTKDVIVHFQFAGYESESARNSDKEDYLFWDQIQLDNPDLSSSIYTQIYNQLKQKEGFTNLIDG
jgi:hypothetical protein